MENRPDIAEALVQALAERHNPSIRAADIEWLSSQVPAMGCGIDQVYGRVYDPPFFPPDKQFGRWELGEGVPSRPPQYHRRAGAPQPPSRGPGCDPSRCLKRFLLRSSLFICDGGWRNDLFGYCEWMPNPCPRLSTAPDLVIYHDRCSDGFGAAWVIRRRFGPNIEFMPASHGYPPSVESVRGKHVVMVDVGFPREVYLEFKAAAKSILLLDHHQSTRLDLADIDGVFFDDQRSGVGLAWDACFPGQARPRLVELIEDRDLCRHHIPQSKWLCLLDGLPMQFEVWDEFAHRLEHEPDRVRAEARLVTSHEAMGMARVMTHAIPITQGGMTGWQVNAPHDMAYRICVALSQLPQSSFGMSWYLSSGGVAVCSWRPRPGSGVDVSRLAEEFGGGGNPYAAGARMTLEQIHALSRSMEGSHRERLAYEAGLVSGCVGHGCGPSQALRDRLLLIA